MQNLIINELFGRNFFDSSWQNIEFFGNFARVFFGLSFFSECSEKVYFNMHGSLTGNMACLIGCQSRSCYGFVPLFPDFSIPVCHSKVCRCPSICRSYVGREFWFQGLVVHQCALGRAHERPVQRRSKYRRRDRRGLATGEPTSHTLRIKGLNFRLKRGKLLFFTTLSRLTSLTPSG